MELNKVLEIFETPFDNPLVPRLPVEFRNCEILTAFYRTDMEAAHKLVPPPLEVIGDLVIVHVYHANDTDWFGNYYESAVHIPVRLPSAGIEGAYSPYLFLSNDGAVAAGREIYGQPKKSGQPRLELRDDLFVGTVSRNGIDVITTTMAYKHNRVDPNELTQLANFRTNINLKIVPGADGNPAICQLTAREFADVRIHECWMDDITVELRPNAQAPVYRLPVREVVRGFYWRADFKLVFGRVIYDYLGQEAA